MNAEDDSVKTSIAPTGAKTVVTKQVKPGWRTSEFWITFTLPVVMQLLTNASHVTGPWGMAAGALGAGLYSLSRGWAKR